MPGQNDSIGITAEGVRVFPGHLLFKLKDTHGLPLDFSLDRVMVDHGMPVDWVSFIRAARDNGWWDFQTHDLIEHALIDIGIPSAVRDAIMLRIKLFMIKVPHPSMV